MFMTSGMCFSDCKDWKVRNDMSIMNQHNSYSAAFTWQKKMCLILPYATQNPNKELQTCQLSSTEMLRYFLKKKRTLFRRLCIAWVRIVKKLNKNRFVFIDELLSISYCRME